MWFRYEGLSLTALLSVERVFPSTALIHQLVFPRPFLEAFRLSSPASRMSIMRINLPFYILIFLETKNPAKRLVFIDPSLIDWICRLGFPFFIRGD